MGRIMLETIAAVNQAVNNFVWGVPAMVCIIGVGLLLERADRLFADPQISVCHQNHHRPHVPQKGCLGRRYDAVPGGMHCAGGAP